LRGSSFRRRRRACATPGNRRAQTRGARPLPPPRLHERGPYQRDPLSTFFEKWIG
jgi:hypothetical protein